VTLRQLRYFAVLGEELNYRRAAERLFITQPALSTAIKQLEHQLGVMLFTRSTREVALTELGQAWLPKVKDALRGVDSAVDELVALSAHYRRIRLGYLIGTGADLLFRLVRHFEAAHPEITVEPREFDFSDPTAGLADGSTEVAIIRPPVDLPEHRMFILDAEDWVASSSYVASPSARRSWSPSSHSRRPTITNRSRCCSPAAPRRARMCLRGLRLRSDRSSA
jgi:DNA-binding transcriptional LysR family regulator